MANGCGQQVETCAQLMILALIPHAIDP